MMYLKNYFLALIAIVCISAFQSCKKSGDPAPTPVPAVKPDTLTAGWTKQVLPEENYVSDIYFNTNINGYLCTGKNLYKSTDGGISWVKLSLPVYNWFNCFVTADGKAFFIPQANIIYKTLDGGSSFVNTGITSSPVDIFFSDNTNGFCITGGGLYNTVDEGLTWQKLTTSGLPSISSSYASLSFLNSNTGWVVSQNGIHRSVGSLANWQQSTVNGATPGGYFGAVYAVSASIVYATNIYGEIFKSTDGGINFNHIKKLEDAGFTDIHFLTSQIGYASSGRSIYKTTDAGINWTKVVSLGESTFTEIHFTDATHGWACGSGGVILTFKQ